VVVVWAPPLSFLRIAADTSKKDKISHSKDHPVTLSQLRVQAEKVGILFFAIEEMNAPVDVVGAAGLLIH
jgi:hypothetical protein